MKCEEFREIVHDLLRDETLDRTLAENAFAHAESCNACYDHFGEVELLHTSLRSLAARHASEQAPRRVQEALLAELAQSNMPATAPEGNWVPGRALWIRWAGVAVAAAAAIVLTVFLVARHDSARPSPAETSQSLTTMSQAEATPYAGATAANYDQASVDEGAVAGPFLPLSESFDPASLDDSTVVRVVLSPAAIESLGIPLSGGEEGQIVADMVITNDGTPQAIRVVGW